jgi:hypothetical protein
MYPSFTGRMRGLNAPCGGQSIAEGIAVKDVGKLTYGIARPLIDDVLLLEEPFFERAVALYCNVEKTVVEGAGAASLAALIAYPERFRGKKCGLIITGASWCAPSAWCLFGSSATTARVCWRRFRRRSAIWAETSWRWPTTASPSTSRPRARSSTS